MIKKMICSGSYEVDMFKDCLPVNADILYCNVRPPLHISSNENWTNMTFITYLLLLWCIVFVWVEGQ